MRTVGHGPWQPRDGAWRERCPRVHDGLAPPALASGRGGACRRDAVRLSHPSSPPLGQAAALMRIEGPVERAAASPSPLPTPRPCSSRSAAPAPPWRQPPASPHTRRARVEAGASQGPQPSHFRDLQLPGLGRLPWVYGYRAHTFWVPVWVTCMGVWVACMGSLYG